MGNPISLEDLMDEASGSGGEAVAMADIFYDNAGEGSSSEMMASSPEPASPASDVVDVKPLIRPSIIVPTRRDTVKIEPNLQSGANEFLYVESKRARLDREKEERRPQPIIKKRKKNSVPEDLKDDKYWEKRNKNKEATRRSREARRLKENQIVLRAAYLEKENRVLKQELDTTNFEKSKLETEIDILKRKLQKFESMSF